MATITTTKNSNSLVSIIDRRLDVGRFREQHWEGAFWEYLDVVLENPAVWCVERQRQFRDMPAVATRGSQPRASVRGGRGPDLTRAVVG